MPLLPPLVIAFCSAAALAALVVPAAATDPLAASRGRARVLLVFAPTASDPSLAEQRATFAGMREGARERDLVLVEAIGSTEVTRPWRATFGVSSEAFAVVLIGKDGGAKLRSATVLDPARLFQAIDAMPMRQEELRSRRRIP